ncbi:hypothetical protein [Haloferula sp. BvORR071]|uniref:hypothetical protein n=1 Tax=Haloferula sp. BvORR071 TaxID=1396141 RepID=UPI000554DA90|nr:hypothetical protein [Haloferula sp. BvORR071]
MRASAILPLIPLLAMAACWEEKAAVPAGKPAKTQTSLPPATSSSVGTNDAYNTFVVRTPEFLIRTSGEIWVKSNLSADEAAAALAEIRKLPLSSMRDAAIGQVIRELAKGDPAQARALLKEWTDAANGAWKDAAATVAIGYAKSKSDELMGFVTVDVPPGLRSEIWGSCLWEIPAKERLAYLDQIVESRQKLWIVGDLVSDWLREDPQAAVAWLDGFAAGKDQTELAILAEPHVFFSLDRMSPPPMSGESWLAALRLASTPEARAFLARQALAGAGAEPAGALMNELAEADPAVAGLARDARSKQDPAAYAAGLDPAEAMALPAAVAEQLVQAWAEKQPRRALEWALEQGRPEAATALEKLYSQEPQEALALLPKLTPGKELDNALGWICITTADQGQAEMARSFLKYVGDPDRREKIRKRVEEEAAAKAAQK